jgi:hypothetical protein
MLGQLAGDIADAGDVGVAVGPAEAEALAQVGADLVAVQQLDPVAALGQGRGELGGHGRLARPGQAGQPQHEPGVSRRHSSCLSVQMR